MKRYIKKIITVSCMLVVVLTILENKGYINISNAATYKQTTIDAYSGNKNGIESFPESYQIMLNKLVENTGHTNWKFKALYTDIDWNELVANETDCLHNTIYKSSSSPYPSAWYHSCNKEGDAKFYCASKEITSYYMDPRNFITEIAIFQFLDLSNSSTVTVKQIEEAVKGTYLAGSANGQTYAQMIYDAAEASGESAFSIIVRIFQELGNGTNLPYMISGTDSTYPGVYNFFNYGATDGAGNLQRGLAYAQNAGWTTPQKALIEGAKLIAGTYTKAGQLNKYLYKFDVVGSEKSELYRHQYMTNVEDPNSQANILYKAYDTNDLLDKSLTFVIPVYKNMPAYVKLPGTDATSGNLYYVSSNYTGVTWRQSPGGTAIGTLRKDTVVTMLQENVNGFGKISYNGTTGYMSMQYLTKVNTKQDVYSVPVQGVKYLGTTKDEYAMVTYSVQLQGIGWTGWAKDGGTIGTTGENRRLETIKISLYDAIKSEKLQYRVHVSDVGWMNWVSDGATAGVSGKSIEAIQIKLRDLGNYNIKYRVCIEGDAWTDWVENGTTAGTTGQSQKITAIEIKIEEAEPWDDRGTQYKGTENIDNTSLINYDACLQNAGWMGWRISDQEAGSSGQRRKLEAFKIKLSDTVKNESVQYSLHLQDVGWTDWVSDGEVQGIAGGNKRIEAIQIKLKNGTEYDVQYRVHVQDIGWMDWKKNGEVAGTTGQLKRIEAIQIKLVKKDNISVSYSAHVQDVGWMNAVKDGATAGTTGQSKRVEAIKISLSGTTLSDAIQYKVHVQDVGWMDWKKNGEVAGTTGQLKRIEAIQIKLNSQIGKTVKYRVHVEDIGWMDWVSNGTIAGTTGQSKRIEAIEIKIE